MVFYGQQLRMSQGSALLIAAIFGGIAYWVSWSNETLTLLSFSFTAGYAVRDEVIWLQLESFARRTN